MQRAIRFLLACASVLFATYESGTWLAYRARANRLAGIEHMQIVRDDAIARARVALLLALLCQGVAVVVFPIYLPKLSKEKHSEAGFAQFDFARRHPMTFVYSLRLVASLAVTALAVATYYLMTYFLGVKLFTLP
jgi:hypothetical protein